MKIVMILFFLLLIDTGYLSTTYGATSPKIKTLSSSKEDVLLELQEEHDMRKRIFLTKMKKAKYFIVNGDLDRALLEIIQAPSLEGKIRMIAERYRALIAFLKEEYTQSYKILNAPIFERDKSIKRQICLLQTFNMIALQKKKNLLSYFAECKLLQGAKNSTSNFQWGFDVIELLIKSKNFNRENFLKIKPETLFNLNYLRSWLKQGLYYNQEKTIMKYIAKIPKKAYKSKEIRELLAMIFFRSGNNDMALHFLENIHSVNAENIRGSINLQKNQLELAFGHFQLALKDKKDSLNAIERLIPISWKLHKYEDALRILNSYHGQTVNFIKKQTLFISQLLHLKEFEQARTRLQILNKMHTHQMPHILNLMSMYANLMTGHNKELIRYASTTCQEYDGLSCWYLLQTKVWHNLTHFVHEKNEIAPHASHDLDSLKQEQKQPPLIETHVVDQAEIEELDYGFYHP